MNDTRQYWHKNVIMSITHHERFHNSHTIISHKNNSHLKPAVLRYENGKKTLTKHDRDHN